MKILVGREKGAEQDRWESMLWNNPRPGQAQMLKHSTFFFSKKSRSEHGWLGLWWQQRSVPGSAKCSRENARPLVHLNIQSRLYEHCIFTLMMGERPYAKRNDNIQCPHPCLGGIQLWLQIEVRGPLSMLHLLAYKCRQVFIVTLYTSLEAIKCRLEIQHNVASPKTRKEKKSLNVSLLFLFYIL